MSVTEELFHPLLASPAKPLITHYDEQRGSRVELSRATVANWAAKTANWLTEECDVEPGAEVAVLLPAHWQTIGVLLGAWWCGARIIDNPNYAEVTFTGPDGDAAGARTVAVVALDPLGQGLASEPSGNKLDYLNEIRVYGDDFQPWHPITGDTLALGDLTVTDVVAAARRRTTELGIEPGSRVMSTLDWAVSDGVIDGLLTVLAAQGSLVQCGATDADTLAERQRAERTTVLLSN